MKDIIYYSYHISIEEMKEYPEYSSFEWNDKQYIFIKLKRTQEEFQDILIVVEELLQKRVSVFSFIQNVNHSFLTKVGDDFYVLLEVYDIFYEYGILEMLDYNGKVVLNKKNSTLYRNEWSKLWSEKIDYLEYQVHELGRDYPVVLNSFSYYIGLAENAICYLNYIDKNPSFLKQSPVVLSHKRVYYPNYRLNYDNPLNYIFDVEVRDVAEYLKSMALVEPSYALIDLKTFIEIRKPDLYNMSLLYARLLFPSYYFDLHEKIFQKLENEEKLLPIIDQIETYENFLYQAWLLMSSYVPIEGIDWLQKKEL